MTKTFIVTMEETIRQKSDLIIEAESLEQAKQFANEYINIVDSHIYCEEMIDFKLLKAAELED